MKKALSKKIVLPLGILIGSLLVVLTANFPSFSRWALKSVGGSFNQRPYSTLRVGNLEAAQHGYSRDQPITLIASNRELETKTYHWSAYQTLRNGDKVLLKSERITIESQTDKKLFVQPARNQPGTIYVSLSSQIHLRLVIR
jgi:hypothetical protein